MPNSKKGKLKQGVECKDVVIAEAMMDAVLFQLSNYRDESDCGQEFISNVYRAMESARLLGDGWFLAQTPSRPKS